MKKLQSQPTQKIQTLFKIKKNLLLGKIKASRKKVIKLR